MGDGNSVEMSSTLDLGPLEQRSVDSDSPPGWFSDSSQSSLDGFFFFLRPSGKCLMMSSISDFKESTSISELVDFSLLLMGFSSEAMTGKSILSISTSPKFDGNERKNRSKTLTWKVEEE